MGPPRSPAKATIVVVVVVVVAFVVFAFDDGAATICCCCTSGWQQSAAGAGGRGSRVARRRGFLEAHRPLAGLPHLCTHRPRRAGRNQQGAGDSITLKGAIYGSAAAACAEVWQKQKRVLTLLWRCRK